MPFGQFSNLRYEMYGWDFEFLNFKINLVFLFITSKLYPSYNNNFIAAVSSDCFGSN